MAKRKNSAQRLYEILKIAASQNDRNKLSDVWAHAFGLENESSTKRSLEVVENIGLIHNQFEVTKNLVSVTDYSPELFQFAFNRIDRVLSVDNLSSQWASLKSHLAPDTLLALNWISEVLPDEVASVDKEFIKEIETQLSELKKIVQKSELPLGLKIFINKQIEIIEKALRQNEIIGTKAIRNALYEGFSNTHDSQLIVSENENSEELGKLGKIWQKMKKVPGVVINTNKTLNAGANIAEKGQKILNFLDNFQL